ncbi:MAG TPA: DUF2203 domain-containing protein [Nitrosopumilaceae archaeon]|nr:DUF2203 domain-containing protein [Nitrosopumilaceae archaeon]
MSNKRAARLLIENNWDLPMFSYFTVTTANKTLPEVIKKYNYVLECKTEVVKAEQQLQITTSDNYNFEQYTTLKRNLNSKITKFYQAIDDLENTGVVVKSIDEGLLDFPAKRFDEEIWLCWKKGETEIKFWHEKDVGFMGRKPIEVNDETLV